MSDRKIRNERYTHHSPPKRIGVTGEVCFAVGSECIFFGEIHEIAAENEA